jgi:cell division septation protein DedD
MVLVGQPELLDLISGPQMRQLRQRVSIHCTLEYLTGEEIDRYIARRLFIAGDKGHVQFTRNAIKRIYKASKGVPRLINKICDYALTAGYIADDFVIGPGYVKKALKELGDLGLIENPGSTGKSLKIPAMNKKVAFVSASAMTLLILLILLNYLIILPMCKYEKNMDRYATSPKEIVTVKIHPPKERSKESIPKEIPPIETRVPSPFTLQLGSFKSLKGVIRAVSFYKEREIEAHWHHLDLGANGKWYRLFTGQFGTEEEAQKFRTDYGLLKSIVIFAPWSVLVGQPHSGTELNHMRSVLLDNQYDSYDEKSGDGRHRVFTGVFINRDRAERLAQEINDLGFLARVISR